MAQHAGNNCIVNLLTRTLSQSRLLNGRFHHSAACSLSESVSSHVVNDNTRPLHRMTTWGRRCQEQASAMALCHTTTRKKRNYRQDRDGGTGIALSCSLPSSPPRAQLKIAHAAARLHLQYSSVLRGHAHIACFVARTGSEKWRDERIVVRRQAPSMSSLLTARK